MSDGARVVIYRRRNDGSWQMKSFFYVDNGEHPWVLKGRGVQRYLNAGKQRYKYPRALFQFPFMGAVYATLCTRHPTPS